MKKKSLLFVGLVMLAMSNTGMAQPDEMVFNTLIKVRSLKCDFSDGYIGKWENGKIKIKPDKWHTPLYFDSIDLTEKKARLIANQGSDDVAVITTLAGITFVEITPSGNVNFTTVFAKYNEETKDFIAVTSRHIDLHLFGGGILPSQYHGTCKVWE